MTDLRETVFQAIGAASTCWEYVDRAGVFDSERASAIGELLVVAIEGYVADDRDRRVQEVRELAERVANVTASLSDLCRTMR